MGEHTLNATDFAKLPCEAFTELLASKETEGLRLRLLDLIAEDAIRNGLEKARWPGRFSLLRGQPPFIAGAARRGVGRAAAGFWTSGRGLSVRRGLHSRNPPHG